mmetsp:Transcript_55/g.144  ORF Transcript_55/g.144 Transcript_55/m.144 type:complete len:713 (-) Transcript_55:410-2548(-)
MIYFQSFLITCLWSLETAAAKGSNEYLYAGRTTVVTEYDPVADKTDFRTMNAPKVVEFYSPDCPYCIEFSSSYIQLAKSTTDKYPEIKFFGVSCDKYEAFCDKYNVEGFPTVKLFGQHDSGGVDIELEPIDGETPRKVAVGLNLESASKLRRNSHDMLIAKSEDSDVKEAEDDNRVNEEGDDGFKTKSKNKDRKGADDDNTKNEYKNEEKESADDDTTKGRSYKSEKKLKTRDGDDGANADDDDKLEERKNRNAADDDDRAHMENLNRYSRLFSNERDKSVLTNPGSGESQTMIETNRIRNQALFEEMTKGMKQHMMGTMEFASREKRFFERIKKSGIKRRHRDKTLILRKENLPFAKHIIRFKRSEGSKTDREADLILDASLSVIVGLESGLKMGGVERYSRLAMIQWLDLLSISLPPEWHIHKLIDELRSSFKSTKSTQDFKNIIKRQSPSQREWSASCQNQRLKTTGFSCGFWKLLHVVTIGVAEQHGGTNLVNSGMMPRHTVVFSPALAADTIRNYIDHFFTCRPCRKHFLATYDDVEKNRRKKRLVDDAYSHKPSDWKELSLWLWEVHNDVALHLEDERYKRNQVGGVTSIQYENAMMTAIWPSLNDCALCFNGDGTWIKAEVFRYLERTYWPDSENDPLTDELLVFYRKGRLGRIEPRGIPFLLTAVLMTGLVFVIARWRWSSLFELALGARHAMSSILSGKSRTA